MKNMKKWMFLLLAFSLLFFGSCKKNCADTSGASGIGVSSINKNGSDTSTANVSESNAINNWTNSIESANEKKILNLINNVDSYDRLISKSINIDSFIEMYDDDPDFFLKGAAIRLKQLDEDIGIECIRKTDTGMIYSVHKVRQGGLLYIYYNTTDNQNVTYVRNWYYVKKSLSFNAFTQISEGSNITDVEKIDPATSIFIKKFNNFSERRDSIRTFHYLNDGILSYLFEYTDGKLVVSSVDFDENFYARDYGSAKERLINGRVLSIDRLK